MVLILESRSHLDLGDLPNLLAAELGVMTVRLERAIRSLDGVARVHVSRWGDGSAHLHMWFLARPYGRLQLRGTFLSLWDSILPPISEEQWRENLALVAAWLAEFGGRPLAEPPRIQWQAPSSLAAQSAAPEQVSTSEGASLLDVIGETAEPPELSSEVKVAAENSASDTSSGTVPRRGEAASTAGNTADRLAAPTSEPASQTSTAPPTGRPQPTPEGVSPDQAAAASPAATPGAGPGRPAQAERGAGTEESTTAAEGQVEAAEKAAAATVGGVATPGGAPASDASAGPSSAAPRPAPDAASGSAGPADRPTGA
ncbi:hypothetical protein [Micromonospora radicis]|nr:hypothetical protein [Micromonospora radicis]